MRALVLASTVTHTWLKFLYWAEKGTGPTLLHSCSAATQEQLLAAGKLLESTLLSWTSSGLELSFEVTHLFQRL